MNLKISRALDIMAQVISVLGITFFAWNGNLVWTVFFGFFLIDADLIHIFGGYKR